MFQYDPNDDLGREPFTRPTQRPPSPTTERVGRPPSLLGGVAGQVGSVFQGRGGPVAGPKDQMQPGGPVAAPPSLSAGMRQAQPVARFGPLPFVQPSMGRPFNPRDIVGTAPQPPRPDPIKWDPASNPGPGGKTWATGRPPEPAPMQMEPPEPAPAPAPAPAPGGDTAPGWRRRAFLDRLRGADEETPSPFIPRYRRKQQGGTGGPMGPPPATY